MPGPVPTLRRSRRHRRLLTLPAALLLGVGMLGATPASATPTEPSPPVLVGEPQLDCSCGGLYVATHPDYASFNVGALTWTFAGTPQDPDNTYRVTSTPGLPDGVTEAWAYDGEGHASVSTDALELGTTYAFVVEEVAGASVVASSAPVSFTPQRVEAPSLLEIRDASGVNVDVLDDDPSGHLVAGATYTLHWTGDWGGDAVLWNGLNYRHPTNGMTLVTGGRAEQPWSGFTVPADLAGKDVLVEIGGIAPGKLPVWFGTAWVPVVAANGAPLGLSAASAAGTPRVGQVLTASGGTSPAGPARTFQWKRDGRAIAGATTARYRLVAADAGRRVTVTITGTKTGYATSSVTGPPRAVAALSTRRPSVTGTARVGRRLTATRGAWIAPGHTFGLQWLRNGRAIRGAVRASYVLSRADRGARISVRVTARRPGFPVVVATSAARAAR